MTFVYFIKKKQEFIFTRLRLRGEICQALGTITGYMPPANLGLFFPVRKYISPG